MDTTQQQEASHERDLSEPLFCYLNICLQAVVTLLSWISAEERSHEHNLTS